MKIGMPNIVSRKSAMTVLKMRKNSPTILFGGGIVLGVATVVTACRATLKIEDILDEHRVVAKDIKNVVHDGYTDTDRRKDLSLLYLQTAGRFTRIYGPSFVLGVTSVACLTQSHRILNSRNAGLAAAYSAVDKAFDEYRERVRKELGDDKDQEFRRGVTTEEIEVAGKDGSVKKKTVKKLGTDDSMYARYFGEGNQNWSEVSDYNTAFLRLVQNWANDRLKARGHLFLSEVYDELGFDRTPASTQVGWLWSKGTGDDFVDFGIWREEKMAEMHSFMSGQSDGIWLDFNVDGEIWRKI